MLILGGIAVSAVGALIIIVKRGKNGAKSNGQSEGTKVEGPRASGSQTLIRHQREEKRDDRFEAITAAIKENNATNKAILEKLGHVYVNTGKIKRSVEDAGTIIGERAESGAYRVWANQTAAPDLSRLVESNMQIVAELARLISAIQQRRD